MDANGYLEKLCSEAYKREGEQEENVHRSLPFFATSLTLIGTIAVFVRSSLPPFSVSPYPLFIHAVTALIGVAIFAVIFFLYQAVRQRSFEYIMREVELVKWTGELRDYYAASGTFEGDLQALEDAVIADVREEMVGQYARTTEHNRKSNLTRLKARGRALLSLIIALAFAFSLIGAIFINDIVTEGSGNDSGQQAGNQ